MRGAWSRWFVTLMFSFPTQAHVLIFCICVFVTIPLEGAISVDNHEMTFLGRKEHFLFGGQEIRIVGRAEAYMAENKK